MVESMCGCICSGCEFVEKCGCKGCFASKGYPFHGECKFALCCMEHGYTHCGECEEFPCQKLTDYAYDPEYGDENGSILEVLRQWSKDGARGQSAGSENRTVQEVGKGRSVR